MYKRTANAWDNVSFDLEWLKKNVCDLYYDGTKTCDANESVDGSDFKKLFEGKPPSSESFTTTTTSKSISKTTAKISTEQFSTAVTPESNLLKRKVQNKVVTDTDVVTKKSKKEIEGNEL